MMISFVRKTIVATSVAVMALAAFVTGASAETRTLSLYFPHTKESLTVTYKKDGRYISTSMKQLNWFFRDWRSNVATKMDPRTIDLLWALHKDLGAKKPAHIVSGFRSHKTNSMLRRIGRKVARRSQHIQGRAIDVYFPDVPSSRLRGSALARRIGGVGYYPRSGKHGFVHIDSGSIRHWPRMSPTRLAGVIKAHRHTIGARHTRSAQPIIQVASRGPVNILPKRRPVLSSVAQVTKVPVSVPLPRARPLAVAMAAAAAETYVMPVSAPAIQKNFGPKPSLAGGDIGTLLASTSLENRPTAVTQHTNKAGKGSFAGMVRDGTAKDVPLLRPMQASYASNEFWWSGDMNKLIRREGAPQPFNLDDNDEIITASLTRTETSALQTMINALTGKTTPAPAGPSQIVRSGKSDSLIVNRAAKGDMLSTRPTGRTMSRKRNLAADKLAGNFEAVLKSADQPIGFAE